MEPASFDESNAVIAAPPGIHPDDCPVLSVWIGTQYNGLPVMLSCWKLTVDELAEIQKTGRVWLTVMGHSMPPVTLATKKPLNTHVVEVDPPVQDGGDDLED